MCLVHRIVARPVRRIPRTQVDILVACFPWLVWEFCFASIPACGDTPTNSQEPVRAGCFFHENSSREGGPLVNAVKQRALLGFSLAGKVPCSQLTPLARSGVPYVVAASSHKESPFSNALPSILHVIETASNSSKFTTTAWKPPTYMSALLSRSKPESTSLEQIG